MSTPTIGVAADVNTPCIRIFDPDEQPDRLISQYKDSEKFKEFLQLYKDEILGNDSVLNCWNDLSIFFCIDQAAGEWLDVIGIIVGQPRFLFSGLETSYFGFQGHPSAESFGETGGSVGGFWYDENVPLTGPRPLTDPEYRLAIRARIAKNHHTGTIENTITIFELIFQAPCQVLDLTDDYTVFIGKTLDNLETAIIQQTDLTPNVLGFKRNTTYGILPVFGFLGLPGSEGFGSGTFSGFIGEI